ncbi:MAG: MBL fold metallo-hydrolase [bacterium]
MHISWLGQTCIKLQTKNQEQDAMILFDPYKPKKGNFPRSFSPDVVMYSNTDKESATLSQNPFVIDSLGEFDLKNIVIYSICGGKGNYIFKIVAENLTIVHLGRLQEKLNDDELEKILNPDILFIPAGGQPNYIDRKSAASLAMTLEPRIIMPIGYNCDTEPDSKPVSLFISEVGLKPENESKKVIIKKKDLPQEETRLIILDKE